MENWNRDIYVIIPCYNEEAVISNTVSAVLSSGYSVLVVDDASSDGSGKQIEMLAVHYIRHRINLGQGAALQTGIDAALKKGAVYFVTFDADGQHDANDIEGMLQKLEKENLDVVMGSRFLPGASGNVSAERKLLLKTACMMNYFFTGILLTDAHNGLRAFNRHAAKSIRLKENRMAHATEFLQEIKKNHLRFAEYPVHIRYTAYSRRKGQSFLNSIRIFLELALNKIFD